MGESRRDKQERLRREMTERGLRLHIVPDAKPKSPRPSKPQPIVRDRDHPK